MSSEHDGINGTDSPMPENVQPLFPDRPSAAPMAPSPAVVSALEALLADARSGKIQSFAVMVAHPTGQFAHGVFGLIPGVTLVGALENFKLDVQMKNLYSADKT